MPIQKPWTSTITKVEKNKLTTRDVDQQQIIRNFTYPKMVFLLTIGREPLEDKEYLLGAVINSHCSHGITGQSTIAVRMAVDCRSSFLNAALAGFLVGSGKYHQGALQASMEMLTEAGQARQINKLGKYIHDRLASKKPFDKEVERICQQANMPLLRITNKEYQNQNELLQVIQERLPN